jgi:hypothetical protein
VHETAAKLSPDCRSQGAETKRARVSRATAAGCLRRRVGGRRVPPGGSSTGCRPKTELQGQVHLTLLHTSDIHSRLFPYNVQLGQVDAGLGLGEATRLSTSAAPRASRTSSAASGRAPRGLHLDGGDCFQGAPVFNFYSGEAEIRALSAMGTDAMIVANHEFDGRAEPRHQIQNSGRASRSSSPTTSWRTRRIPARRPSVRSPSPSSLQPRRPQGRRHRHGQPLQHDVDLRSAEPPRDHPPRDDRGRAVLRRPPAPVRRRGRLRHAPGPRRRSAHDRDDERHRRGARWPQPHRPAAPEAGAGLLAPTREREASTTSRPQVPRPEDFGRGCTADVPPAQLPLLRYAPLHQGRCKVKRYCAPRPVVLAHSGAFAKYVGRLDLILSQRPERSSAGQRLRPEQRLRGPHQRYHALPGERAVPEDPSSPRCSSRTSRASTRRQPRAARRLRPRRLAPHSPRAAATRRSATWSPRRCGCASASRPTSRSPTARASAPIWCPVPSPSSRCTTSSPSTTPSRRCSSRASRCRISSTSWRRSAGRGCVSQVQIAGARVVVDCTRTAEGQAQPGIGLQHLRGRHQPAARLRHRRGVSRTHPKT